MGYAVCGQIGSRSSKKGLNKVYKNREFAGNLLAKKLNNLGIKNGVVLGIPGGGVPIAKVIAEKLALPIDVVVTKKLRAQNQPELAIGAVGPDGNYFLDKGITESLGENEDYLKKEIADRMTFIKKRIKEIRGDKKPLNLTNKTIILVDDGIATGATVKAALNYIRAKEPKRIILAVPVLPNESVKTFSKMVDKLVFLQAPKSFYAVGQFYKSFPHIDIKEVVRLLKE